MKTSKIKVENTLERPPHDYTVYTVARDGEPSSSTKSAKWHDYRQDPGDNRYHILARDITEDEARACVSGLRAAMADKIGAIASSRSKKILTIRDNVVYPGVTVQILEVMSDASGAPAVLEYHGYVYAFDQLGSLRARIIRGPVLATRSGSIVALGVLTHAYVTLLGQRVDDAWREANARMYEDAPSPDEISP